MALSNNAVLKDARVFMPVRVSIVYPADPLGVVPGGIDTFIRGILKYAPPDIDMRLVGVTTDADARPSGRWTCCKIGSRTFEMYPLLVLRSAGSRGLVPLSVRFTAALAGNRHCVDGDVVEFHRLEPAIVFAYDHRPKNAFIHQNMQELKNRKSDILWSRAPWLYYRIEDWLLPKFASIFAVREDAVAWYHERYPGKEQRICFIPTWVDPDVFPWPTEEQRAEARRKLRSEYGLTESAEVIVSVGRLDKQKDPLLLATAFAEVARQRPGVVLVYVGDGVLREELEGYLAGARLNGRVMLAGLKPGHEIARMHWGSDLFVLSSAYEGMPMSVLEALATGLPVASTDVGEVRRVVKPGINGVIFSDRTPASLAIAILSCLDNKDKIKGRPCFDAVSDYVPTKVLGPVYENYRRLANMRDRHGKSF